MRSTSVSNNPQAVSIDEQMAMQSDVHIDTNIVPSANVSTPLSKYPTLGIRWNMTSSLYNSLQDKQGSLTTSWTYGYHYKSSINFTGNNTGAVYDTAGSLQGETWDPNPYGSAPVKYQWWIVNKASPFTPRSYTGNLPSAAKDGDYVLVVKSANENKSTIKAAFVFGDSLSDTHSAFNQSNGLFPRGAYYNGRFSNGPNWVDDFEELTGIPTYNYAFGGAEVMPVSRSYGNFHSFNNGKGDHYSTVAYGTYEAGSDHAPNIPNLSDELTQAVPLMQADAAAQKQIALVVLMGGNDYKHLVNAYGNNPSEQQVEQYAQQVATTIVQNVSNTMSLISGFGPTPLLVYTELGDMSISPVFANRPSAKQFANYLNADVEAALAKSSINYVINKSQSVSGYIAANPTQYKIVSTAKTNPKTDAIWGNLSDSGNFNSINTSGFMTQDMSHNKSLTPLKAYIKLQTALNYNSDKVGQTLFSGYLHPSAKAHALMAYQFIYNLAQSGYLDLDQYTDPTMGLIASSKGITNPFIDTTAFNTLISNSAKYAEARPDWAQNYLSSSAPQAMQDPRHLQEDKVELLGKTYYVSLDADGMLSLFTKSQQDDGKTLINPIALPKAVTNVTYTSFSIAKNMKRSTFTIALYNANSGKKVNFTVTAPRRK